MASGDSSLRGFSDSDSSLGYRSEDEEHGVPVDFCVDPKWRGVCSVEECDTTCGCGLLPHRYVCSEGSAVGRRFIGCKKKDGDRCSFNKWIDGPCSNSMKVALKIVWSKMVDREVEKQAYKGVVDSNAKKMDEMKHAINTWRAMHDLDEQYLVANEIGKGDLKKAKKLYQMLFFASVAAFVAWLAYYFSK